MRKQRHFPKGASHISRECRHERYEPAHDPSSPSIGPPGRARERAPEHRSGHSPERIEALRKLVASGQYHVSPRWIATRIFRMAGVKLPE